MDRREDFFQEVERERAEGARRARGRLSYSYWVNREGRLVRRHKIVRGCSPEALVKRIAKLIARYPNRWLRADLRRWLREDMHYPHRTIRRIMQWNALESVKSWVSSEEKRAGRSQKRRPAPKEMKNQK